MTRQEQIVEAILATLRGIKKDALVPNLPPESAIRFRTTPKTVTRALSEPPADMFPAVFVTDPMIAERHLLADLTECTMTLFVSGALYEYNEGAIQALDILKGDVRSALVTNPTWNGLALRTRILRLEANTEIEEPSASFTIAVEIDYHEYFAVLRTANVQSPLQVDLPDQSRLESIVNTFHNVLLNMPEISWVQRAHEWPPRPESIQRSQCPGLWYFPQNLSLDYRASMQAEKRLTITVQLVDVETDSARFPSQAERWVSQFVMLMGRYADLSGRVLTVDVQSVRTNRSVFPLVVMDADLLVKYYESFLVS